MASSSARTNSATATSGPQSGKIDPTLGLERRWVIYNGDRRGVAACRRAWHGWLHHTVDVPPTEDETASRGRGEKPHRPNLTGTPGAHRPTGSTLAQGRRPKATGDYKAWTSRTVCRF